MSILITADLHLTSNPLDEYRFDFLKSLKSVIIEHKVKTLLILGDLTDKKDRHCSLLVNKIIAHLIELSKIDTLKNIIILKGNHDYKDSDEAFFDFLSNVNKIQFISTLYKITNFHEVGSNYIFIPNVRNEEELLESLKQHNFNNYSYIFMHQLLGKVNTGSTTQTGNESVLSYLKQFNPLIIAGDIHIPQVVDNKVIYVGAPYHIHFGDTYKSRMLLLVNKEIREIKVNSISKRKIDITEVKELEQVVLNKGDQVKINILVKNNDLSLYRQKKHDVIQYLQEKEVVVISITPLLETKEKKKEANEGVSHGMSLEKYFKRFCTSHEVPELYIKTGELLLQETE